MAWSTQVKRCKRRHKGQAKDADRLGPKGMWSGSEAPNSSDADVVPPAKRRDLNHPVIHLRNVVSPLSCCTRAARGVVRRPDRAAGTGGGSKRRPVRNGPDRG